jgi:hypothetical protein
MLLGRGCVGTDPPGNFRRSDGLRERVKVGLEADPFRGVLLPYELRMLTAKTIEEATIVGPAPQIKCWNVMMVLRHRATRPPSGH